MTLRQEQVLKNLPKNGYNVSKTLREVGYSESSSNSGAVHRAIRNYTRKAWTEEGLKKEIDKHKKVCSKVNDRANVSRMLELKAKVIGIGKETQHTDNTIVIVDKTLPVPVWNKNEQDLIKEPVKGIESNECKE